jgi:hypothetical protein
LWRFGSIQIIILKINTNTILIRVSCN